MIVCRCSSSCLNISWGESIVYVHGRYPLIFCFSCNRLQTAFIGSNDLAVATAALTLLDAETGSMPRLGISIRIGTSKSAEKPSIPATDVC